MEKVKDMKKTISSETLGDSEMKGVSSLLKMKEGWREDGIDCQDEGLNFVLRGIDMNTEENDRNEQEAGRDKPDGRSALVGGSGSDTRSDLGINRDVSANGEDLEEIGKLCVESKNEKGGALDSEEHGYSVGDFVWGKIKSHPWWPGRVYHPSDASKYAAKLRQEGKLLVAYFGDGTFAWCHPSQLRPFGQNFEDMMNQSSSRAFHHAIDDAMEEIGKLVNLKMTCTCVRTEKSRPFVVNRGVKQGVLLPNEGIYKVGVSWPEPADVLASLRRAAQLANSSGILKVSVLKGWILGFYNAKTGSRYKLPEYVEPEYILGLEDHSEDAGENGMYDAEENGEMGVLSRGPIEEDKESGKHGESENGTQRKHKSIADILGASLRSKDKVVPSKRRISNLLESSPVVQSGGSVEKMDENGEGKKEKKRVMKKKKREIQSSETGGTRSEESKNLKVKSVREIEAKETTSTGHLLRERKKSRYLSPPYTNPVRVDKKGGVAAESLRISSIGRFGERMAKAAESLVGLREKLSPEGPVAKQVNGETVAGMEEIKASAKEVLLDIRSLACDPRRKLSGDAAEGFLHDFRSSVYIDESKTGVKSEQSGRKRKSQGDVPSESNGPKVYSRGRKPKKASVSGIENAELHWVPISYSDDQAPIDLSSPETNQRKNRVKKAKGSVLGTPNMKKTNESKPTHHEKRDKGASLVVSFGPGSSLPTKDELLHTFETFGSLNESKTKMYSNNCSAIIVFKKTCDAESALESSLMASPFGTASVNFKLHPTSPMKPKKGSAAQPEKLKKPMPAAATPESEASEVDMIKERLQMLTSMLEKSSGRLSKKMRTQLEGNLKGVLEKITAAGKSSTSC
ncbi:hypothetical protein SAY86_015465 [Trapa natans]|uniref:PWWP domain-containing protein n=1 Tax=Trapa natans TaxID=22666 RepID=A0AAN7L342_TRANT|nr:hypothetical protein SAY86_015465 [Trapa natans]